MASDTSPRRASTATIDDIEKEKYFTQVDLGPNITVTPASLEAQQAAPVDPDVELLTLPPTKRWRAYLNQQITIDTLLELELYILTFATGIQDAMTFAFYGVFCSKQTGNLVTIALSAMNSKAVVETETHIAISFISFLAGAALFGHFGNLIGQKRRGWLIFVNALQTVLVIAACAIRKFSVDKFQFMVDGSHDPDPYAGASIAMLAFASGGQIALALSVGMAEVNTTMVTGAMVMLAHDKNIFKKHNPGRNRKLFFIISILGGSFVGAVANRFAHSALSLLLVSICKVAVTFMFLCNRGVNKKPGSSDTADSSVGLMQIIWGD